MTFEQSQHLSTPLCGRLSAHYSIKFPTWSEPGNSRAQRGVQGVDDGCWWSSARACCPIDAHVLPQ